MYKIAFVFTPFKGEKEKCMWSGNFLAISGVKGCDNPLRCNIKTPQDNVDKNNYKGVKSRYYVINKIAYNKIIPFQ